MGEQQERPTMDAALKSKWVEALRGGEFKQGQRALRRGDCFCCLGVLCEVMGAEWQNGEDVDLSAIIDGELQEYYLSPVALVSAGLTGPQQEVLYKMNDDDDKNFLLIADYIEANL